MFFGRQRLASTGVTVSEQINEPAKMKITVNAIGRNIFPSTPSSVKIGI